MSIKHQGFTLLELLIVMATIAVLATVLIPNIIVSRRRALDTKAKSCLKEISTAQNVYTIGYNRFAADLDDIDNFPERTCTDIDITTVSISSTFFEYNASHVNSDRTFAISANTGVATVP